MRYFFDTSAIVKYYHSETGTQQVSAILAEPESEIRISSLGFLEIQSAFAMKVRSGMLDRQTALMLRSRFLLDIAAGEIEVWSVVSQHFAAAERLVQRHSYASRLRTLDALQLAVAMDLASLNLADRMVVADQALALAAESEGLTVINPEASGSGD